MSGNFASYSNMQSGGGENPDVSCTVNTCKYHGKSDYCKASSITVKNDKAQTAAETNCATFLPR